MKMISDDRSNWGILVKWIALDWSEVEPIWIGIFLFTKKNCVYLTGSIRVDGKKSAKLFFAPVDVHESAGTKQMPSVLLNMASHS